MDYEDGDAGFPGVTAAFIRAVKEACHCQGVRACLTCTDEALGKDKDQVPTGILARKETGDP
jgi:hypothetical protein